MEVLLTLIARSPCMFITTELPRILPKEPLSPEVRYFHSPLSLSLSLSLFGEGNANEEGRYKITALAVAVEKLPGHSIIPLERVSYTLLVVLQRKCTSAKAEISLNDPVFSKLLVVDILGLIRRWAVIARGGRTPLLLLACIF